MPRTACRLAWQPKWPCITFASGSTENWGATHWPLLSYSNGNVVISIHTKRLN
jgi:hypothetical protein